MRPGDNPSAEIRPRLDFTGGRLFRSCNDDDVQFLLNSIQSGLPLISGCHIEFAEIIRPRFNRGSAETSVSDGKPFGPIFVRGSTSQVVAWDAPGAVTLGDPIPALFDIYFASLWVTRGSNTRGRKRESYCDIRNGEQVSEL